MTDILRQHITNRLGKDIDNLDEVLSRFTHIQTKRNEQLLQQGNICRYVYFIAKGCLQVYVHDKDFNETTRDLLIQDNWCSELLSFGSGQPATVCVRQDKVVDGIPANADDKAFQQADCFLPGYP